MSQDTLIIFPAIDLMGGQVVRLRQGQFDQKTDYSSDPVSVALHWKSQGAKCLHLVDLDGAKTGEMKNFEFIKKITQETKINIQVGGGVRSIEAIKALIDAGVKRVILGTKAISDKPLMQEITRNYLDYVAVSIDCANGLVTQRGWVETTALRGVDFAKQMQDSGIKCLIYTDIHRDGMMQGPNIESLKEILNSVSIDVIASGGISGAHDILALCQVKAEFQNLLGAITGKAIYELKDFDVQKAIEIVNNFENLSKKK